MRINLDLDLANCILNLNCIDFDRNARFNSFDETEKTDYCKYYSEIEIKKINKICFDTQNLKKNVVEIEIIIDNCCYTNRIDRCYNKIVLRAVSDYSDLDSDCYSYCYFAAC